MEKERYDPLKIQNQLCFPLYVASKELVRAYRPFLEKIDLTYTQYIAMMILWENKKMNVKELGEKLFLDSGTLTPVLKVLEKKGLVTRKRSFIDERVLDIELTKDGEQLKHSATFVPVQATGRIKLSLLEAIELNKLLGKVIDGLKEE